MKLSINGAFEEALYSKNKYLVLYGGAGSGKSVFAAQKIIMRLLSETPHKFLVVRKVARTLRESVFALFKEIIFKELEMFQEFKINETNMTIEYLKNGNKIIFFGLDNPEKIKSIAGITGIWIEEVTELKREDFDQLDIRLRGETKHYKQIILTFNPVSAQHWVKKYFFDKKVDNSLVLKTTYLDNPFINKEYKETFERIKEQNYDYYKIYALGHWGTLKGLIYTEYEVVESMPQYFEKEYIGMDFGYNHPFSIVHIRIEKDDLFVDEIFYKTEMENPKVVEWAKKNASFMKKIQIYADSARPDLINEWRVAGFRIEKANKSVFEGINTVKSFNLKITKRSVNILREIDLYSWKEDKEGKSIDEPIKLNDDAMDAIRYALTPYIKKSGKTKSFKLKGL
jgi:phage terminase large subunit